MTGKVVEVLNTIYQHSMSKAAGGFSYQRLNATLYNILSYMISGGLTFEDEDWDYISEHYNSHFWLGVSSNGKHHGECLYANSCLYNYTSAIGYEKTYDRQPFLIGTQRVYVNYEFKWDKKYCRVTGWSADNKSLHVVGYDSRINKKGKVLLKFNRDMWLKLRNEFITF